MYRRQCRNMITVNKFTFVNAQLTIEKKKFIDNITDIVV